MASPSVASLASTALGRMLFPSYSLRPFSPFFSHNIQAPSDTSQHERLPGCPCHQLPLRTHNSASSWHVLQFLDLVRRRLQCLAVVSCPSLQRPPVFLTPQEAASPQANHSITMSPPTHRASGEHTGSMVTH